MVLNISLPEFKKIFDNEKLYLPIRWDGNDFICTLDKLYHLYQSQINETIKNDEMENVHKQINAVCSLLINSINAYLNGFPSDAFSIFCNLMNKYLMRNPLKLYKKSITELFELSEYFDPLNLYRVVRVSDNTQYNRARVFHTPYNLRSKVSTSRYSIAGYPSLYLGTSIELCEEEVGLNPYDKFAIASLFKIERNLEFCDTEVSVIELALKPQDFFEINNQRERIGRRFSRSLLSDKSVRNAYLLWYPLIATCSYIRVNKSDPFAAEYIIPQLLMQWVRKELDEDNDCYDKLIGIRYFSCASVRASDIGFNYVFPTSGKQDREMPFCSVLMKAFKLTKPVFIHEFCNVSECEVYLQNMNLDKVKY